MSKNEAAMRAYRLTSVEMAARWASNMLVEVLSNHGHSISDITGSDIARDGLRDAVAALDSVQSAVRKAR